MDMVTKTIVCAKEMLTLTNQRAIYWKRENALILSDLHIGKTAHFRKYGIPIPTKILNHDLATLTTLIEHFKVLKIIIVGDLFHAEANNDLLLFNDWLQKYSALDIVLVLGNHDRIAKQVSQLFNTITMVSELTLFPFQFVHDPVKSTDTTFMISGHTHPGVLIKGKGRQRIKLPCYQANHQQLILPAFSLFTGLNTKKDSEDFVNYAFTNDSIFKVIHQKIVT